MHILIAEDDLTSRAILLALLEKAGHEVQDVGNGAQAWAALQRPDGPRLAVLDWMMPEMDGLDVVRRVREMETEQPPYIIMLTARCAREHMLRALDAGADDYLTKPYDPAELRARIAVGTRVVEMQSRLCARVAELTRMLREVRTLQGIVPICAYCKKIRDDAEYWHSVEDYVQSRTDARFSHSICPECAQGFLERLENER